MLLTYKCIKRFLWYPNKFSIYLATQFKIGIYMLNREKRNIFPRSTDIIQVLNTLPTDKRHIKVPLDKLLFPTSGVPLMSSFIFCLRWYLFVCYKHRFYKTEFFSEGETPF